jgi:[ribosomal protein S5]-alanine N-acetyltransferase
MVMEVVEMRTARLVVRTPRRGDGAQYASYYAENKDFLQAWSPTFRREMFSARDWEDSIPLIYQQYVMGSAIRFGLYEEGQLIGVANVIDIKKSPAHFGTLGYTLSEDRQGRGLMREALEAVMDHCFGKMNLHRLTANYMPRNERSGRLLRKLGFNVDGYSRDYLLIDGKWEDHVMCSIINEQWNDN